MKSSILTGKLMHCRHTPIKNLFTYPVYNLLINLDELPLLDQKLTFFSYNRRNLISIHDIDYWDRTPQSIKAQLAAYLERHGATLPDGDIYLLTNARVFGYVFNPVSFFYCYHKNGELAFIVADVSNTDHERYPYLLDERRLLPAKRQDKETRRYGFDKRFYVSPLIPMEARYEITFSPLEEKMFVQIDEFHQGEMYFQARLWGDVQPLTNRSLFYMLWRYPLMSVQIMAFIYWQAIKTYRKGVPSQPKPAMPPTY